VHQRAEAAGLECPDVTAPSILVIDDNVLVRDLWCDFLGILGYAVTAAGNWAEGMAMFDQMVHDLVVTDLVMPGLSGWDVVDAVRRRKPDTPVILVSGSGTDEDAKRALREGLLILAKPVELRKLEEAIKGMLPERSPVA
jgi:CheY-like chemotaxis protein